VVAGRLGRWTTGFLGHLNFNNDTTIEDSWHYPLVKTHIAEHHIVSLKLCTLTNNNVSILFHQL
jgi:hypothetical protein